MNTVHFETIRPPEWRTTHCLRPDLKLLQKSMMDYGWIAPIVVQKSTSYIIDGFHRWFLAQSNKPILKRDQGFVPVTYLDVDEVDAMIAHVRLNRARGEIVPRYLSSLVKDVLRSRKYEDDDVKKMLGMGVDEFSLLTDGAILKKADLAEYEYSKAWIPVESNGNDKPTFERPPNADS